MLESWSIRAVQLDLARQLETPETIREFIGFAAEWGYNTLFLYLEGVVRTEHFPFRDPAQSYTPDEIRSIVDCAGKAGLQVVPCVNTLAHADHFLACPELSHLREAGCRDRIPYSEMFCPSAPATYEFLGNYISDLVPLFPGDNFHIGCDETWGLGCCPRCRSRLQSGETWGGIFLQHLLQMRSLLQKLGKRVWIWDDMLELMPEIIDKIPRDVLLCSWQYEPECIGPDRFQGHFNGGQRHRSLQRYERLGFDVLVCPWASMGLDNTIAITNYARQHRVAGGLQTIWELSSGYLPRLLPVVAFSGHLWSNPGTSAERCLDHTLRRLFPEADACLRAAVTLAIGHHLPWQAQTKVYVGPPTPCESRYLNSLELCKQTLIEKQRLCSCVQQTAILDDLLLDVRHRLVVAQLRTLVWSIVDTRSGVRDSGHLRERATWCQEEIRQLASLHRNQWLRHRAGILPETASGVFTGLLEQVKPILEKAGANPGGDDAILILGLFLYEPFSLPFLRVEAGLADRWEVVLEDTTIKPPDYGMSYYDALIPFCCGFELPERLRFTVSGYGGQGIFYAGVYAGGRTLEPCSVIATSGEVAHADSILKDDRSFCYLGSRDTENTLKRQSWSEHSSVTVSLRDVDST